MKKYRLSLFVLLFLFSIFFRISLNAEQNRTVPSLSGSVVNVKNTSNKGQKEVKNKETQSKSSNIPEKKEKNKYTSQSVSDKKEIEKPDKELSTDNKTEEENTINTKEDDYKINTSKSGNEIASETSLNTTVASETIDNKKSDKESVKIVSEQNKKQEQNEKPDKDLTVKTNEEINKTLKNADKNLSEISNTKINNQSEKSISIDSERDNCNSTTHIILFVTIGINFILLIVLFIIISKIKSEISKVLKELKTKPKDNNQNQIKKLSDDLSALEENLNKEKINLESKIDRLYIEKDEESHRISNAIKEKEQNSLHEINRLKSELDSEIIRLEDKVKNNQKLIEENKNRLNSNFDGDKNNEDRIDKLERDFEEFKKNKNKDIYGEATAELKVKIRTFQDKVANHLLKEHPECKWWIRFAEPNKIFPIEISNKISDIINNLVNKEELKGFSEFFDLYRRFYQIKLQCDELDRKIENGEIGYDNSFSGADFKQSVDKYNEELDYLNNQIENISSIEIDAMGMKLLAEERKKIINWIVQESQEINKDMAIRLSIELINPEIGTEFDDRQHDSVFKDNFDSKLPNNSIHKVSKRGYKDLLTGETIKAKVFVNKN